MKSRREFLKWVMQGGVFLGCSSVLDLSADSEKANEIFLGGFSRHLPKSNPEFYFSVLRADGSLKRLVPIPFRLHSVLRDPNQPDAFIAISTLSGCARIEPSSAKVNLWSATPGHHFAGHGVVLSGKSPAVAIGEMNAVNGKGLVVFRETETGRAINTLPSHGFFPHEMHLTPSGKELVIAHGSPSANGSSLTWIDTKSGKLLHEARANEADQVLMHFALSSAGTIAIAGALQTALKGDLHQPKLFTGSQRDSRLIEVSIPSDAASQVRKATLFRSVAIHPQTQITAFTEPKQGSVFFVDLVKRSYLKNLKLSNFPSGVCVSKDNQHFVVSHSDGRLSFISATSLTLAKESKPVFFNSAHLEV